MNNNPRENFFNQYSLNKVKISYIILSIFFVVLMVPLIFSSDIDIYDAKDEETSHYPTILSFLEEFPNLDLINYKSATTPLYHIVLTLAALIFGSDIILLRFINLVISLCCLLMVFKYFSSVGNHKKGVFFALIFLLSPYFIGPAIRLSTDNAALLFAFLSLYIMRYQSTSLKNLLLTNVLILCAFLTRQMYVWLIIVYLIVNLLKYKSQPHIRKLYEILLPTLLPITGGLFFLYLWKGFTPPRYAEYFANQLNLDAPVYIVSLVGLYGIFFFFWLLKVNKKIQGNILPLILIVVITTGYLLMHPVSNEYPRVDHSIPERGGALWLGASYFPNVLSSGIVFWGLFNIGAICLYITARYLIANKDHLMVIAFSVWILVSMVSFKTYQKYYEPFILFYFGYFFSTFETKDKWFYWIGPGILLVGFIILDISRFF